MQQLLRFDRISTELLRAGYEIRFRAEGGSMEPAIRSGEVLLVQPVALEEAQIGRIFLFQGRDWLTAHRLVGRVRLPSGETGYLFHGDATDQPDAPVPASAVLGRVTAVERDGEPLDLTSPNYLRVIRARCPRSLRALLRPLRRFGNTLLARVGSPQRADRFATAE